MLSFKIEHVCGIPQIFKWVLWVGLYPYNIFLTNGYCCISQSINKIIKFIDWVSKPPTGRKFIFCAYVIVRINTKSVVSSNFFLWLVYLGPLVCSTTIICQLYHLEGDLGYKILKEIKFKMLSCELIVKFQN